MGHSIGPERWAAIRRIFEGELPSVADLAVATGLARSSVNKAAAREGWVRLRFSGGTRRPALVGEAAPRGATLQKLWTTLDRQLEALDDGDAQKLSALARTLERLIDMERDLAERDKGLADGDGEADDIDSLLAELARRLEALP